MGSRKVHDRAKLILYVYSMWIKGGWHRGILNRMVVAVMSMKAGRVVVRAISEQTAR
jgi:hypothetical protein